MAKVHTRRNFLLTAPLVAVSLPLTDTLLSAEPGLPLPQGTTPQTAASSPPAPMQVFRAQEIETMLKTLHAAPASKDIVGAKGMALSMTITTENTKAAKEFEFHEHRDHVFQILEGTTRIDLGGTALNAHQTRPGEWLAPDSEGHTSVTLAKGDMIVIPRMTPHKRATETSVSFLSFHATARFSEAVAWQRTVK